MSARQDMKISRKWEKFDDAYTAIFGKEDKPQDIAVLEHKKKVNYGKGKEKKANKVAFITRPTVLTSDPHGDLDSVLHYFKEKCCFDKDGYLLEGIDILNLGDIMDRGTKSIETMLFFLILMREYPKNVISLRGNHESRDMWIQYGADWRKQLGDYKEQFMDKLESICDEFPLFASVRPACRYIEVKKGVWQKSYYFCCHGAPLYLGGKNFSSTTLAEDLGENVQQNVIVYPTIKVLFKDEKPPKFDEPCIYLRAYEKGYEPDIEYCYVKEKNDLNNLSWRKLPFKKEFKGLTREKLHDALYNFKKIKVIFESAAKSSNEGDKANIELKERTLGEVLFPDSRDERKKMEFYFQILGDIEKDIVDNGGEAEFLDTPLWNDVTEGYSEGGFNFNRRVGRYVGGKVHERLKQRGCYDPVLSGHAHNTYVGGDYPKIYTAEVYGSKTIGHNKPQQYSYGGSIAFASKYGYDIFDHRDKEHDTTLNFVYKLYAEVLEQFCLKRESFLRILNIDKSKYGDQEFLNFNKLGEDAHSVFKGLDSYLNEKLSKDLVEVENVRAALYKHISLSLQLGKQCVDDNDKQLLEVIADKVCLAYELRNETSKEKINELYNIGKEIHKNVLLALRRQAISKAESIYKDVSKILKYCFEQQEQERLEKKENNNLSSLIDMLVRIRNISEQLGKKKEAYFQGRELQAVEGLRKLKGGVLWDYLFFWDKSHVGDWANNEGSKDKLEEDRKNFDDLNLVQGLNLKKLPRIKNLIAKTKKEVMAKKDERVKSVPRKKKQWVLRDFFRNPVNTIFSIFGSSSSESDDEFKFRRPPKQ